MKQVLIDGDPFAYRAAFSCEDESIEDAIDKVDDLLDQALQEVLWSPTEEDYQVFLTGRGNFRYDIAVTHEYKGNRKSVDKPQHLQEIRQHMEENWSAIVSEGEEADDLIGIWATKYGPEAIVISIDKDMLQIPCTHYNPNKREFKTMTEFEGLKFFYTQILTGDRADNIVGLYGIGPAKANVLLGDCETEQDLYEACLRAYGGEEDRVIENARLLWLRRYEGQVWEPPKCVSDQA
jgi:5'-3' exonuclease